MGYLNLKHQNFPPPQINITQFSIIWIPKIKSNERGHSRDQLIEDEISSTEMWLQFWWSEDRICVLVGWTNEDCNPLNSILHYAVVKCGCNLKLSITKAQGGTSAHEDSSFILQFDFHDLFHIQSTIQTALIVLKVNTDQKYQGYAVVISLYIYLVKVGIWTNNLRLSVLEIT